METHIALFRGINVGGNASLPMKELVGILQDLGCQNVRTYIQSGNAVFDSAAGDPAALAARITAAIQQRRGFAPHVLLLRQAQLEQAMVQNPFREAEDDPASLHLGFLAAAPPNPDLAGLERLRAASERYRLIDSVFYLHAPEGVGRSKLAAGAEKLLGVAMTDRNWRSVRAIADLARQR